MIEWGEPQVSWKSSKSTKRSIYQGVSGRVTLNDLISHMREVAPDVSFDNIYLNYATVKWFREATEEELAERQAAQDRSDQRHVEWEARYMRILMEKYGEDPSTWPAISQEELDTWREKYYGPASESKGIE